MAEPLRVLHVFGRLDRGGAETMVMNLYRRIDRDALQFDFVVCDTGRGAFEDEIASLGGRVYRVPRFSPGTVFRFVRAWRALLREHPEYRIIHGHLRSTASVYLGIARRRGLVTVAHSHSTSSGKGFAALVKNLLQLPLRHTADYLVACSDDAGVWLYGKKAVAQSNYFVLKNALDAGVFRFDEGKRRAARDAFGLDGRFVVGHIGAFLPVKNHRFLIDVFHEVCQKNSDAVLLLVGDGPLREETEAYARGRGLSGRVVFTGVRRETPDLLCAMDVFVLPSKWEGLPLTAVEAQASGLPCLLSDAVTRETAISPLVSFCPPDAGAPAWAEKILSYAGRTERPDMTAAVRDAGYDSADTAAFLQSFYFEALEKARKP
jgi:glycosyltransferase involved in cell wall biosynthesis